MLESDCTVLFRPDSPETVVDSPETVEDRAETVVDRAATVEAEAFWAEPSVSTVVDSVCTVPVSPDSPDTVEDSVLFSAGITATA